MKMKMKLAYLIPVLALGALDAVQAAGTGGVTDDCAPHCGNVAPAAPDTSAAKGKKAPPPKKRETSAAGVDPKLEPYQKPELVIGWGTSEIFVGGGQGAVARRVFWRDRPLILDKSWALEPVSPDGRCLIQVTYDVTNFSKSDTGKPFRVDFLNDGKKVSEDTVGPLKAGETKRTITKTWFSRGDHKMTIRLDAGKAIAEALENDNDTVFAYSMLDPCTAGATKPKGLVKPAPAK